MRNIKNLLCIAALVSILWAADDAVTALPKTLSAEKVASPVTASTDALTIPRMLSYQGKLTDANGVPVPDGNYQLTFRLYTEETGGTPFWTETQTVTVRNGLFSVLLGAVNPISSIPEAGNLYLSLQVGTEPELSPRLRIVSSAYAFLTERAGNSDLLQGQSLSDLDSRWVNENQENSITSAMITDGEIVGADLNQMNASTGQVLKWNGTTWAPADDEVGQGPCEDEDWKRLPYPGPRLTDSVLYTYHQLGIARGEAGNFLYGDRGTRSTHINLGVNSVTGTNGQEYRYCTVGGGNFNTASAWAATVPGGDSNTASGPYSTVGGGLYNTASRRSATVGGGEFNTAQGDEATVSGGTANIASGHASTVGGGERNAASAIEATVGGGGANTASAWAATVAGGDSNTASGSTAFVGGGFFNRAGGSASTVSGGQYNSGDGNYATVGGGSFNSASQTATTVGGGVANSASQQYATVGGGLSNTATGQYATVGGGRKNIASGWYATIGGGDTNTASGHYATVGGGEGNIASDTQATVSGGSFNIASRRSATVGGGEGNTASNSYATVGGGAANIASGPSATVAGGYADTSAGICSFTTNYRSVVPPEYNNSAAFNGTRATASNQLRCASLQQGFGGFTIDHPLDPYDKFLNHYFVYSPESRNIYEGSVVLDATGRAEVKLPDYFPALNRNPHIQLTGVGTKEVVYVAEDVVGNRFVIGGPPGAKVYWQVTGERKDVCAEAARRLIPVEQAKTGPLAGTMADDEFLAGCMEQLEREGKAQGLDFRTAAGRKRYEDMRRHSEESKERR